MWQSYSTKKGLSVRGFSIDDIGVRQGHTTSNVTFVTGCFHQSQCQFTADCENINVIVGTRHGKAALPHMHAPAFSLGTCAHHSVTWSNETADSPRNGTAFPAAPLISLSASLREWSQSQGLKVAGGGVWPWRWRAVSLVGAEKDWETGWQMTDCLSFTMTMRQMCVFTFYSASNAARDRWAGGLRWASLL